MVSLEAYPDELQPVLWLISRGRISAATSVWSDCIGAGIVQNLSRRELLGLEGGVDSYHTGADDDEDNLARDGDGAMLTNFKQNGDHRDWTVRLVNENGDQLVVSKV